MSILDNADGGGIVILFGSQYQPGGNTLICYVCLCDVYLEILRTPRLGTYMHLKLRGFLAIKFTSLLLLRFVNGSHKIKEMTISSLLLIYNGERDIRRL